MVMEDSNLSLSMNEGISMGKLVLVLGGARSGKSRFAAGLASKKNKKTAFVATCVPADEEMKQRIAQHRSSRPASWKTFEEAENLAGLIAKINNDFDYILLDCLTLWLSNLLLKGCSEDKIQNEINKMVSCIKKGRAHLIIVSNEVGSGIVPEHKLGRDFRDMAGRIHQSLAHESHDVYLIVSGIPCAIKKNGKTKKHSL
jgi:adenosylcobinamide kinase/adenosylcobinamide-phosphate guanylyltransferase